MALPTQRTLQHIRQQMRVLCGMNSQVSTAAQLGMFDQWVRDAETETYWVYKFNGIRIETDVATVIGQRLYDWPDVVDPTRAMDLQIRIDNLWLPVHRKGIGPVHDTVTEGGQTGYPTHYDDGPQLELWPVPDAVYTLRMTHYTRPRILYSPSARADTTAYAVGDRVVPASGVITWPEPLPAAAHKSHFTYECTTAGTSGTGEPVWPTTDGATVSDGTAVWTARLNTTGVPSDLVSRLALYKAKLRYRQPEAEAELGSFQTLLDAMKANEMHDKRFVASTTRNRDRRVTELVQPVRV